MGQTDCSETSAYTIRTPANYPEESTQLRVQSFPAVQLSYFIQKFQNTLEFLADALSTLYETQNFDYSVHNGMPVVPVPIRTKPVTSTNCIIWRCILILSSYIHISLPDKSAPSHASPPKPYTHSSAVPCLHEHHTELYKTLRFILAHYILHYPSFHLQHHTTATELHINLRICVTKTNLMNCISSVYFINQPLHVSGISVAHHQEVYCSTRPPFVTLLPQRARSGRWSSFRKRVWVTESRLVLWFSFSLVALFTQFIPDKK